MGERRIWRNIGRTQMWCLMSGMFARWLPHDKLFTDVKFVFHYAGIGDIVPSIEQPTEYMSANVQGTVHVLEAARHARAQKVVYAASSSCYGLAARSHQGRPSNRTAVSVCT